MGHIGLTCVDVTFISKRAVSRGFSAFGEAFAGRPSSPFTTHLIPGSKPRMRKYAKRRVREARGLRHHMSSYRVAIAATVTTVATAAALVALRRRVLAARRRRIRLAPALNFSG